MPRPDGSFASTAWTGQIGKLHSLLRSRWSYGDNILLFNTVNKSLQILNNIFQKTVLDSLPNIIIKINKSVGHSTGTRTRSVQPLNIFREGETVHIFVNNVPARARYCTVGTGTGTVHKK